jgi:hypothetical protein
MIGWKMEDAGSSGSDWGGDDWADVMCVDDVSTRRV